MTQFIHLRTHSAYSLLEGAIPVKKMPGLCEAGGFPALAITDTNNLFGALEFSETIAGAGVQPIIGCQLAVRYAEAASALEKAPPPAPLVLLAQSEAGYLNLMRLVSAAYLETDSSEAVHVTMDALTGASEGLICLSGGLDGPAGRLIQQGRTAQAGEHLDRLAAIFPQRLYVELHRHGSGDERRTPEEAATEPAFLDWAYANEAPIVATNDVYFAERKMHRAHDALICIAEGRYVTEDDRRKLTEEYYFKSADEMAALFDDLPEAIEATVEIARRCHYRPLTRAEILPKFADDEVEELRRQARVGLAERLKVQEPVAPVEEYEKRLDYELGVIEGMGFPGYFLIVADFIKWAKDQHIPVGPGRGSGAGSLVAWSLTITDLDPLRYGLLFERFLNPERISMPDFDIDFCQDRREEVIHYVQRKYGHDRVAQIITFGTLQSKAAVRDVGRVLQMPYGQVDRLSKMIPVEGVKPVPIERARVQEPRLQEEEKGDEAVKSLLDIGQALEGLLRNASTHAAGVVIGDRPLHELVPLYRDPRSEMPVTQFNMKWVEPAGLVKFDFLGLKTLTVLQGAIDLLKQRGIEVDLATIPLDDEKTYDLYSRADTVGVFQVEGAGMRDALRQLRPTCIEDIVALVALYRPGPMENIPKYCNVKNGRESRESLHPLIDPILDETQGIIVYQEQVMEIARKMAGYSLGGADLLRRAMGKKIQEAMDAERPKFLEGAKANGVDERKALEVWNLLDKFANYGFNKSHAAAYGVVSYQTAWMKANYPVEFMASVMNLDLHNTDKLAVYKQELQREGIALLPPDVNASEALFVAEAIDPQPRAKTRGLDEQSADPRGPGSMAGAEENSLAIRYALGAVRNVGREAMAAIAREREANDPYKDVFDTMARVDPKHLNKRALENLIRAGAFDALDPNRKRLHDSVDTLLAYSQLSASDRTSQQGGLFGSDAVPPPRLSMSADWGSIERLGEEHAAFGFYLSGHPLDDYMPALERKKFVPYTQLERMVTGAKPMALRIAGAVIGRDERKSARGNRFAFVQLSDPTALFEVTVFSEVLAASRDLLEPGTAVALTVEARLDGEQLRVQVQGVQSIDDAVADAAATSLKVFIADPGAFSSIRTRLQRSDVPRGSGPVTVVVAVEEEDCEVELGLPGAYDLSPKVRAMLKDAPGVIEVREV